MDLATPSPSAVPKRKRRSLQIGMKTVLMVMTIGCLVLGLWVRAARKQRQAVNALSTAGAHILYDYQVRGAKQPWAPRWVRDRLGEDYFRSATVVSWEPWETRSIFSDEAIAALADLPRLTGVSIYGATGQMDVGFLRSLNRLERFQCGPLIGGPLQLKGLNSLRDRTSLNRLGLINVARPPEGLEFLRRHSRLKYLNLYGMRLNDDDMHALSSLTKLRELILNSTPTGDRGLAHLAELTELRELRLAETAITSEGLVHLAAMNKLEILSLYDTPVDDAAIDDLARLITLKELRLKLSRISDDGVRRLQAALPNCKIEAP